MKSVFTLTTLIYYFSLFSQPKVPDSLKRYKNFEPVQPFQVSYQFKMVCGQSDPLKPLFIVDGIVIDESVQANLDSLDINSVTVLKTDEANKRFGLVKNSGVVIIETKRPGNKKLMIRDSLTQRPIPFATVVFISDCRMDTIMISADSLGTIETRQLKVNKKYSIIATAIGYQETRTVMNANQTQDIWLNRNVIDIPEVVLMGYSRIRRCTCWGTAYKISRDDDVQQELEQGVELFKIFPNPAKKGVGINLSLGHDDPGSYRVTFHDISGRLAFYKDFKLDKGHRIETFFVNHHLTAGLYTVSVKNLRNNEIKTKRLVIQ